MFFKSGTGAGKTDARLQVPFIPFDGMCHPVHRCMGKEIKGVTVGTCFPFTGIFIGFIELIAAAIETKQREVAGPASGQVDIIGEILEISNAVIIEYAHFSKQTKSGVPVIEQVRTFVLFGERSFEGGIQSKHTGL